MKKLVWLVLVLTILISAKAVRVYAAPRLEIGAPVIVGESKITSEPIEADNVPDDTKAPKVEYVLPYPGMLPGQPFYFLKSWRDRIMLALLTTPMKKAQFHLLQSDKFLAMAGMFSDNNKIVEATSAVTQSVTEYSDAITQAGIVKNTNIPVEDQFIDKLERSANKHIELFEGIESKATDANKLIISRAISQMHDLAGTIGHLK
jgi:hypothetical protein